jgi:transposase
MIMNTHRPATNCCREPFDGFLETFERNGALWSNNEYSVVVHALDLTIRPSQDQSQRVLNIKESTMNSEQLELAAFIGLDWADEEHAVCLRVTATGEVRKYTVKQQPEKLHSWIMSLLNEFGGSKIGIAVESSRGGLMHALMQYDFLILYPINPKTLAKYRESTCVSGAKDDPSDAALLMDLIYRHLDRCRPWYPDAVETRTIQMLCEHRRKLVNDKTALTNRLEALLKGYFPQALEWAGALDTVQACDFLSKWPSLQSVQKSKPAQMRKFYLDHGCRRGELVEKRMKEMHKAQLLTEDSAVIQSSVLMVQATVDALRPLCAAIKRFDQELAAAFQQHPDHELFESFPGAGAVMEPRLLAAMGSDRSRFETAEEIQKFSGIAPVTKKSGKMHYVHRRYACPKFLRQTFHEWARITVGFSEWARCYYEYQRNIGKRRHSAIRALAFKWIRIVFHCWKEKVPYNEDVYLASLNRDKPAWAVQAGLVKKVA